MSKRFMAVLVLISLVMGVVGLALAAGPEGNERKGKYLFRKNCRACHAEGQSAKDLSPVTFTQKEWEAAFAAEKVKTYPCADKWVAMSEGDLKDIYAYMYNHAKDSPSPAKCK